jgi:hypothetical protein
MAASYLKGMDDRISLWRATCVRRRRYYRVISLCCATIEDENEGEADVVAAPNEATNNGHCCQCQLSIRVDRVTQKQK